MLAYLIPRMTRLFLGFGRESAGLVVKSFYWGNTIAFAPGSCRGNYALPKKEDALEQHSIAVRKAIKFNQNTAQNNGPSPHPNTPRRLCKRMIEPSATLKAWCNRKMLNA